MGECQERMGIMQQDESIDGFIYLQSKIDRGAENLIIVHVVITLMGP